MDRLLNEMAVYKTELAKVSVTSQFQRIQAMIQSIPDVNISNSEGYTYLMIAVMQHKADVVKLLLEAGADPNIGRRDGVRPLAAVFLKKRSTVRRSSGFWLTMAQTLPYAAGQGRPLLISPKSPRQNLLSSNC